MILAFLSQIEIHFDCKFKTNVEEIRLIFREEIGHNGPQTTCHVRPIRKARTHLYSGHSALFTSRVYMRANVGIKF